MQPNFYPKLLLVVAVGAGLLFAWFMLFFIAVFAAYNFYVINLSALAFFVLYCILAVKFMRQKPLRKTALSMLAPALMIATYIGYVEHDRRVPRLQEKVNYYAYTPFYGDKVAKLDGNSTLKFNAQNLPKIDGATGALPMYAAFAQVVYPSAQRSAAYHPQEESSPIRSSTTPVAFENLLSGKADVIFIAKPSQKQLDEAQSRGVGLVLTPIAKEAFVFFVSRKNSVSNLSRDQIVQIYSGKITNWREAGGKNSQIIAYQRPEGSGSQSALLRIMGEVRPVAAPREQVPAGMGGIIDQVASYADRENAIGYSFLFYATKMAGNAQIKLLSIDGIAPNSQNIKSGAYPFTNDVFAVTREDANAQTREFVEWIKGAQGKELIQKSGFTAVE